MNMKILNLISKFSFSGSEDEEVQEASADCLQNIRKLALACEKFRYQVCITYSQLQNLTFDQGEWKKTGGLGADLYMSANKPLQNPTRILFSRVCSITLRLILEEFWDNNRLSLISATVLSHATFQPLYNFLEKYLKKISESF